MPEISEIIIIIIINNSHEKEEGQEEEKNRKDDEWPQLIGIEHLICSRHDSKRFAFNPPNNIMNGTCHYPHSAQEASGARRSHPRSRSYEGLDLGV